MDAIKDDDSARLRSVIRGALAVGNVDLRERFPEATRALVLALGHRAIPHLMEIIEEAIVEPAAPEGPERRIPGNAATLLADLGVRQAIEPLLALAAVVSRDYVECANDVTSALSRFGPDAVEPALARFASAPDRDAQEQMAVVLTWCGVRDDRIFDALVRVFTWDEELGAMMLLDYGDPRAIPHFVALLDAPEIAPELAPLLDEASARWDLPRRGSRSPTVS